MSNKATSRGVHNAKKKMLPRREYMKDAPATAQKFEGWTTNEKEGREQEHKGCPRTQEGVIIFRHRQPKTSKGGRSHDTTSLAICHRIRERVC